jgi:hypothetical protein
MSRLRELHWSRIFVLYDSTLKPMNAKQTLTVLKYQLGLRYNKNHLKNVMSRPYFWERGRKRDIYFNMSGIDVT